MVYSLLGRNRNGSETWGNTRGAHVVAPLTGRDRLGNVELWDVELWDARRRGLH